MLQAQFYNCQARELCPLSHDWYLLGQSDPDMPGQGSCTSSFMAGLPWDQPGPGL